MHVSILQRPPSLCVVDNLWVVDNPVCLARVWICSGLDMFMFEPVVGACMVQSWCPKHHRTAHHTSTSLVVLVPECGVLEVGCHTVSFGD
jgi:hypothetical protein